MPIVRSPSYRPLVLVDTANLPEKVWLEYRRQGIGGSDAAAVLGISPFRTARDLYYDKLNVVSPEDDEDNWVAKKMGHLLEDLVAEIFHVKTGFRVYQIKKMFQHPEHRFMLADIDFFIELPDGTTAILEIKTTNYNAKEKWWHNGEEIVPLYYEVQGRHYMCVMNIDQVYFCCLYGNNENEVIIRHIARDPMYESELIALEENFWMNHVLAQAPPSYTEDGDLIEQSLRRHLGPADEGAPAVVLNMGLTANLMRYLELQKEKQEADAQSRELDSQMKRLRAFIIEQMGKSCTAVCENNGTSYMVTYNPVRKAEIKKDDLTRLHLQLPEVYERFVTISESRRFHVKMSKPEAA
ncbi:YqaJ viral recombinase family protein [Caproiciproducens sp. R1]|uniref:YqaJ viral recombinase family nuclease n=1 Tax=Caproiciproducens sp. R1 TaxID=3435000 RepID=UPI004034DFF7